MKTNVIILLLCAATHSLFAQIPNADMEQWSPDPTLIGWKTNSAPLTLPPYDPYIVRQDTDRYSGSYAANFYANNVFKAYATTIFPVSSHPQSLSLFYKVFFPPCVNDPGYPETDTVSVRVDLLSNSVVVDSGYWEGLTTVFSYTQLVVPISQNATLFDSCKITIQGGKILGGCGIVAANTQFIVDALSLNYNSASCVDSTQINVNAICPLIYMPVCGCNGVTYGNDCEAFNYGGVTSWTPGACGTPPPGGQCVADFDHSKSLDTVSFTNQSSAAVVTNYLWSFGDDSSSTLANPIHIYSNIGWYEVCLYISGLDSANQVCTASYCDSVYVSDGCIDSSLICPPGSLCCDAPLYAPVCGCDSVTYMNPCIATLWGGVLSSSPGSCDSIQNSIYDLSYIDLLTVSPNPASEFVVVNFNLKKDADISVALKNTLGQLLEIVSEPMMNNGLQQISLPVSGLAHGLYIIEIRVNGKTVSSRKLIKG